MRKDKVSFVLAHIRGQMIQAFGESAEKLAAETLLTNAENMGYVAGRRGRDGGYFITDEGLSLIGEDVEAFKAAEIAADEASHKTAKERQAQAAKERREKLAAGLQAALTLVQAPVTAPVMEETQPVETPTDTVSEEVTEKPKRKRDKKTKQAA
jgi:hypothetical protein